MNIILNQKIEYLIQQQITSGKYNSVNDVIEEALTLLQKKDEYDRLVEEIASKIDIATEQLDKGEGIDGELAIQQLREELRANND